MTIVIVVSVSVPALFSAEVVKAKIFHVRVAKYNQT